MLLQDLPFGRRQLWCLTVSSMEQLIGTALAAVTGVMVPLMLLMGEPRLSPLMQGLLPATSLVGIAVGSPVVGALSDRAGYLAYFRVCPLLIVAGALGLWAAGELRWGVGAMMLFLFLCGFGVGGGYTLDSDYISELMPSRVRSVCVGIAKSTCALGFILGALACYCMMRAVPHAGVWPRLMWIVAVPGALTFLMRLRWWQSPAWLFAHGLTGQAQQAARRFFGADVSFAPLSGGTACAAPTPGGVLSAANLPKVILTGVPWACEGVGVYGIGVFLPMLVSSLGLMPETLHGIAREQTSVELTAWINLFILPGFIVGLLGMRRWNHVKMLFWGFIVCTIGLALLLAAHLGGWAMWVSIAGFFLFEVALNAGPHLMTFVLPSQVYAVADRGSGMGMASLLGKLGAIIGVVIMPPLLHSGGMTLVLVVSGAVMLLGALVTAVFGPRVLPERPELPRKKK